MCQLGTFWIALDHPSKVEMSMTNFVAFFVFMVTVSNYLPNSVQPVPLIIYYFVLQLIAIAVTCLTQSYNTYLALKSSTNKISSTFHTRTIGNNIEMRHFRLSLIPVPRWLNRVRKITSLRRNVDNPFRKTAYKTAAEKQIWPPDKIWTSGRDYATKFSSEYFSKPLWQSTLQVTSPHKVEVHRTAREFKRSTLLNRLQWIYLAISIRKLVFFSYLTFLIIAPVIFFLILPLKYPGNVERPNSYQYIYSNDTFA